MKTTKANNYSQALKELTSFDEQLAKTLKADIPESNAGHYNIILCKTKHDELNKRYINKYDIQTYHILGFESLKDLYRYKGIEKLIVLHDPSKKKVKAVKETKEEVTENK